MVNARRVAGRALHTHLTGVIVVAVLAGSTGPANFGVRGRPAVLSRIIHGQHCRVTRG